MKKLLLITIILTLTNQCVEGDIKCVQCGGDRCLTCYDSYSSPNGRCENWSTRIDFCLTYATSSTCQTCNYGYKESGGQCVKIATDSCLIENQNGDCVMCDERKLVEDGKCEDGPNCDLRDCALCSKNGGVENCVSCNKGLVLHSFLNDDKEWEQKCILQNAGTLNCRRTVDGFSNDCMECEINYYYKAGKCIKATYKDGKDLKLNFKEGIAFIEVFLSFLFISFL